ncbi:MAG: hypothetical protein JWO37_2094 [Acidimicrobiales bacterium]|jgi:uncharacterized protein (TIGR03084 family)|nr:hypothetical protein [Acidimicrobiales bacterium]
MPADMAALCSDLDAETAALDALLAPLAPDDWEQPTPADGWAIRDQVSHLAWFDESAVTALTDPDRFRAELAEAMADPDGITERVAKRYRDRTAAELLPWFRDARARMSAIFRVTDPSTRVPWYGPDMGAASSLTARIMETWAHGQDVADTLGVARRPSAALHHVAHLGVRTLPNSFRTRDLPVPEAPVRVALVGPDGDTWTWGDEGAADVVRGPALDFCLVVTQRRHLADTALVVTGPVATTWLSIAQAFAGPAGPGRKPGQFRD